MQMFNVVYAFVTEQVDLGKVYCESNVFPDVREDALIMVLSL